MKKLVLIAVLASAMFACNSNPSDQIVGTYIPKDAKKDKVSNDTIFIKKIEENKYTLIVSYWAGEEKRAKTMDAVLKDNTLYFEDNKPLKFNENQELSINGVLFKNLE